MPKPNPAPPLGNTIYKRNPFKIKKAIKKLEEQGIVVGAKVKHTFYYWGDQGEREEPSESSHIGYVHIIDSDTGLFEINPSEQSPGHYRTWVASIGSKTKHGHVSSKVELYVEKENPFLRKKKDNPFLRKKQK